MLTAQRRSSIRNLVVALIAIGVVATVAGGLLIARSTSSTVGKAKLESAGRTAADQSEIAARPTALALNTGFAAERLWSTYNDWEPAIAVDPNSSDVYQLTTRYDGPVPCNQCPAPYIIFRRSSDGGAT